MGQPVKNCLHGEKSSQICEISPGLTWDLSWVGWIHSNINDLLLQSKIHHSAISHSGGCLTWVGWFFSYKQLLRTPFFTEHLRWLLLVKLIIYDQFPKFPNEYWQLNTILNFLKTTPGASETTCTKVRNLRLSSSL